MTSENPQSTDHSHAAKTLLETFGGDGRTAVIIGGTGVLCGRMAQILGEAGYRVVVAGRNEERGAARVRLIEAKGGNATFLPVDVTLRESIQALFEQCIKTHNAVDVLINGAGKNSSTPFFDITDSEWDDLHRTNSQSVLRACQIFGRHMADRRTGSIINVGSVSARIPLSRVFTYSMTKAEIVNLTHNLAREFARFQVHVNAIIPGFFPTEQNRQVLTSDRIDAIRRHTPTRRPRGNDPESPYGEPHELDGVILTLASPKAGAFITGAEYVVDGGFLSQTI
jgi:NAD(P)-dependent dehydrogenase (short-subunit alcohol dehydrogenase family)